MKTIQLILLTAISIYSLGQGTICTERTTTPTYNVVLTENPGFDWQKSGPLNSDAEPFAYEFLYWKSGGQNYTSNPNHATIPGTASFSYNYTRINSPWDIDQDNTYDLNKARKLGILDNLHKEGWEIIKKEFGKPTDPSDKKIFVVLYNRYQGILRFLILIDDSILDGVNVSNPTGVIIIVKLKKGDAYPQTGLFSHASNTLNGITTFDKDIEILVPNKLGSNQWLRADIPAFYDACSCIEPDKKPIIEVQVRIPSQADVKLFSYTEGSITGSIEGTETSFDFDFDDSDYGSMQTSSNYSNPTTTKKTTSVQKNKTQTQNKKPKKGTTVKKRKYKNGKQNATGEAQCPSNRMEEENNDCNSTSGVYNDAGYYEYYNGSYSTSMSSFSADVDLKVLLNTTTTGTITTNTKVTDFSFDLPGKNQANYSPSTNNSHPYYNNVLGVVSLLKTPEVDIIEYNKDGSEESYFECNFCRENDVTYSGVRRKALFDAPKIREYKLSKDIEWALNPSANVDVVDLSASLIFEYTNISPDTKLFDNYNKSLYNYEDGKMDGHNRQAPCTNFKVSGSLYSFWDFERCADNYEVNLTSLRGNGYSNSKYFNQYKYMNGPVLPTGTKMGTDVSTIDRYEQLLTATGLQFESQNTSSTSLIDHVFATRYSSLGCISSYTAKFFETEGKFPSIKLKVIFTLKRKPKEGYSSARMDEEFVMIQTYNVKENIVDQSKKFYVEHGTDSHHPLNDMLTCYISAFDNPNRSGWNYPNGWENLQESLVLSTPLSIASSSSIGALSNIDVTADIITSNNATYNVEAGSKVALKPSASGRSIIKDNVKLLSNQYFTEPWHCRYRTVPPATQEVITAACGGTGGTYYTHAGYGRSELADENYILRNNPIVYSSLTAIPNPTTGRVVFHYKLVEGAEVVLTLTDITGHIIATLAKGSRPLGMQQEVVNLDFLPNGVYLYTLETSAGYRETQRLVVAK